MRIKDWKKKIEKADKIFIYGAGLMGKALKKCLTEAPYKKVISGFLVANMDNNPEKIDNIPVMDIAHAAEYKESLVLVALHEKNINGVLDSLDDKGFENVVPVSFDSDLWSEIRGNWFRVNMMDNEIIYREDYEDEATDLSVYVVHSIYDKALAEQGEPRKYEIPIQVGAKLTEKKLFPVRDDAGENISEKNKQYCELTALYWMWKNDNSKYIGLSHYRRKFELSGALIRGVLQSGIDVIVTVPVLNFNTVRGQYTMDHDEDDWDIMLDAIRELYPEYLSAAEEIQNGIYYYAYNMFITRKEIFDAYCEWLFAILSYCEQKIGVKEDSYQNRYIGFLAERLLIIYLTYNKQYKTAIAPKHFIESV